MGVSACLCGALQRVESVPLGNDKAVQQGGGQGRGQGRGSSQGAVVRGRTKAHEAADALGPYSKIPIQILIQGGTNNENYITPAFTCLREVGC